VNWKNRRLLIVPCVAAALLLITACNQSKVAYPTEGASAGMAKQSLRLAANTQAEEAQPRAPASTSSDPDKTRTLAYEHTVAVELRKEVLPAQIRTLQDACNADRQHGCTVLEAESSDSDYIPSGRVRMRLAPGGVEAMIALAGKEGRVTGRSTRAEDLAEPVADTERQLALLTMHRNRLEEFLKSKELKIEQLIAVSKELASAQTQIDALSTHAANLRRRIDTELLTIEMSVPKQDYYGAQSPITDALRSFGGEFKQAIASVIEFVAVLLPWLVIIVPGIVLLRLFWRWIGRWLNRREAKAV
jgi:hypothetical protein